MIKKTIFFVIGLVILGAVLPLLVKAQAICPHPGYTCGSCPVVDNCGSTAICDNTCYYFKIGCVWRQCRYCYKDSDKPPEGECCDVECTSNGWKQTRYDNRCNPGEECNTSCNCVAVNGNGNDNGNGNGDEECYCDEGTCSEDKKGGLVPCGKTCDDPDTPVNECCPCTLCHLFVLFKKVTDFATTHIAIPLAIVMLTIGGIIMVTAAGNPGQIGQGKAVIRAVAIGLILVFAAWLIVNTIVTFLTPLEHPLKAWYEIDCPVP